MKHRSLFALLLALAALLAAGLWLLLAHDSTPGNLAVAPDTSGAPESEVESPEPVRLRPVEMPTEIEGLRGADTTVAWPVEVELELVRADDGLEAPGVAPQGSGRTARLNGRIQLAEGIGVAATLRFVGGLNTGRELTANAEGWFGATDLYPGLALVEVAGPGIPGSKREVRLVQGQDARLSVFYGLPGSVGGTVYGEGDQPLEDVEVELDGQRGRTDAAGQFVFPSVAGGMDVVLLLRKQGYAPLQQRIGVAGGRALPPGHYTFRMERGASLEVALPASIGAPGPASVYLAPATSEVDRKYAWSQLGPYGVLPGTSVRIDDLPPTRIAVRVYHRGALAKPPKSVVVLWPGHLERLEVELEPAPVVRGRVVDARGLAVPQAEVVLEAPDRVAAQSMHLAEMPSVFETELYPPLPVAEQRTLADHDGRFVLTDHADFAPQRYLSATSPDGRQWAGRVLSGDVGEVVLQLAPRERGRARLVLSFPGRFQGLPVRVSVGGELQPEVVLPPSEPLPLDGLVPGRWRVGARWNGELLLPGSGATELELKDEAYLDLPLPPGAIEGQDEDTLQRAGRRP